MNESTKRTAIIAAVIAVAIVGYLIYQDQRSPGEKLGDAMEDAADDVADAVKDVTN